MKYFFLRIFNIRYFFVLYCRCKRVYCIELYSIIELFKFGNFIEILCLVGL